eukprot:g10325.t1
MLLPTKGLEAVGGAPCILQAIKTAIENKRARILQALPAVEGVDKKQHWAQSSVKGRTMLHWAVWLGNLAAMSVLFEAGADETATAADRGPPPHDLTMTCPPGTRERNLAAEVASCRMLCRGPAFRARSWAWPATLSKEAAGADPKTPPLVGVRIYRPDAKKEKKHDYRERLLLADILFGSKVRKKAA